jgi:hypothetical protein
MAVRLSDAAAAAAAGDGTHKGLLDLIGAAPILNFYTGTVNASAESAPSGTLLGAVTLANFGSESNGTFTSSGGSVAAAASGTAGCWQLTTAGAAIICDGACGTSGSDINFSGGLAWLQGGTISVGTITFNASIPH